MSARRRLDLLTRRMAINGKSAAATATGGQCHTDPEHLAQVLQTLADCGALPDVLARAGLTLDDLDIDDLSAVGSLPPRPRR